MRNKFTSTPALAAYAAAAGALALAPTAADAAVVDMTLAYSDGPLITGFNGSGGPIVITPTQVSSPEVAVDISTLPYLYFFLDLDGDGTDDFSYFGNWNDRPYDHVIWYQGSGDGAVFSEYSGASNVLPVAAGTEIGPGLVGGANNGIYYEGGALFLNSDSPSSLLPFNERVFIGLLFDADNDGGLNYGYLELLLTANSPVTVVTILGGAYQSANNTPITIPAAVPEPGTLSLLAVGAAGLAALRRRRRTRAAA